MDAILITNHNYHWSLEKKVENFKDMLTNYQDKIPNLNSDIQKVLNDAVEFKINGK